VILCSRSVSAAEKAVAEEISQAGLGNYTADASLIRVMALDLNSLASIKQFADDFNKTEKRLDFLVLNAGIMALPTAEYTDAGFERQIGVNHYGHFYLTRLLLPKMLSSENTSGRVAVLSSSAHDMGVIDLKDIHYKKGRAYRGWPAYGQSKLANLLFAKELADRMAATNPAVTAVAIHPGVIHTNLWRASLMNRVIGSVIKSKTIPQGAATTVWACVCPRVGTEGLRGAYLMDCGPGVPATAFGRDEDKALRQGLWKVTEEELDEALKKAGLDRE
jgi:retinol dehydrogenase-12